MLSIPFQLDAVDGGARAGTLTMRRGTVKTPVFMPVGTQAAIRSVSPLHLAETGSQIILANTYHLSQRPGESLVKKAGGLHDFMAVDLPILTDSGGFQVFSLDKDVTEEGVTFRYEVNGQQTFLSPERSMAIQMDLGSDIAMVFDECLAFGTDKDAARASVDRTTRWERRSKEAHTREDQSLLALFKVGFGLICARGLRKPSPRSVLMGTRSGACQWAKAIKPCAMCLITRQSICRRIIPAI